MDEPQLPDDLNRCVEFHGHLCPGLVIGYCAAKLALRELSAARAGDEELIAIVENDTCAVDAVQVLTGCTFGKGNLYFRDYGKMVFTLATRRNARSVRVSLRNVKLPGIEAVPEDQRRLQKIRFMLEHDPSEFFDVRRDTLACLPPAAQIHQSLPCDQCGEMVMSTRLRDSEGRQVCIPCDEDVQREHKST